jgi:hypothetical protein
MKSLARRLKEAVRGWLRPGGPPPRYVSRRFSCEDFFRELSRRQVRYVVLRWFETLPNVARGEDVDLLVADEDLPKLDDLFVRWRTALACDVYSVTGMPGSEFQKMAYFPPHLAEQLIARSVVFNGLYRVPERRDYFLSLAYHALYHKGYASGLRSTTRPAHPAAKKSEHDYQKVLSDLAAELEVPVAVDLESLDEHLARAGWRPPLDMLARLALRNEWIHDHVFRTGFSVEPQRRGVAVFLVRERALRLGLAADVAEQLEREGFQLVHTTSLEAHRQSEVALRLRGGNWGRGPWPCAGGPPAQIIVVWDPQPLPVQAGEKSQYPLLDNARILRAKVNIRARLLQGTGRRERFNPLHSSDNDVQAWEYLEILLPQEVNKLRQQIAALHSGELDNQTTPTRG